MSSNSKKDQATLAYNLIVENTYKNSNPNITMKKFIYTLLVAFVCALSFTACTEEEVSPSTELNGGGGGSEKL